MAIDATNSIRDWMFDTAHVDTVTKNVRCDASEFESIKAIKNKKERQAALRALKAKTVQDIHASNMSEQQAVDERRKAHEISCAKNQVHVLPKVEPRKQRGNVVVTTTPKDRRRKKVVEVVEVKSFVERPQTAKHAKHKWVDRRPYKAGKPPESKLVAGHWARADVTKETPRLPEIA